MKKVIVFLLAVMMLSASGCNKKSTTTVSDNSSGNVSETVGQGQNGGDSSYISQPDWSVCTQNTYSMFKKGSYPELDVSITPPTGTDKLFNIIIVAKQKPDDENIYKQWAADCLNSINEEARKQNPDFKASSDGYYGGVFDYYDVVITVTCEDDVLSRWPIYQKIEAGKHTPLEITDGKLDLDALNKGVSVETTAQS